MAILKQSFFERHTLEVARNLVGTFIVTNRTGVLKSLMITEVEAYVGPHDLACHAARGRTPRTEVMFGPAGCFYVYFVYGIHWMLNIVAERCGYPAAVLIRGAGAISGPARVTKFLDIDRRYNGLIARPENGLWFEDRGALSSFSPERIKKTPRIGVDYAGSVWAKKPYRFVLC